MASNGGLGGDATFEQAVNIASKQFVAGFVAGQTTLCVLLFFLVKIFLLRTPTGNARITFKNPNGASSHAASPSAPLTVSSTSKKTKPTPHLSDTQLLYKLGLDAQLRHNASSANSQFKRALHTRGRRIYSQASGPIAGINQNVATPPPSLVERDGKNGPSHAQAIASITTETLYNKDTGATGGMANGNPAGGASAGVANVEHNGVRPPDKDCDNSLDAVEDTDGGSDNVATETRGSYESCDWLNLLVAQIINRYRSDEVFMDAILRQLDESLNSVTQRTELLDSIQITEFAFSEELPFISHVLLVNNGRVEFKVTCRDLVTLSIETQVLVNWPKPLMAALPVSLSVTVSQFSGTIALLFHDTASPSLNISLLDDFFVEFEVKSLIGHRTKIKDLPKITQIIVTRLKSFFVEYFVWPKQIVLALPVVPPTLTTETRLESTFQCKTHGEIPLNVSAEVTGDALNATNHSQDKVLPAELRSALSLEKGTTIKRRQGHAHPVE